MQDNSILKVIDSKINDYDKMLSEVMESENPDEKLAGKYRYYVMCLTELRREFFFKEHAIFELLRENHEKHDTEFVFMDDSSYTVKKDDICSMNDNYVLILRFFHLSLFYPSESPSLSVNIKIKGCFFNGC